MRKGTKATLVVVIIVSASTAIWAAQLGDPNVRAGVNELYAQEDALNAKAAQRGREEIGPYDPDKQQHDLARQERLADASGCVTEFSKLWLRNGDRSRSDIKARVMQQCPYLLEANGFMPKDQAEATVSGDFELTFDDIVAEGQ